AQLPRRPADQLHPSRPHQPRRARRPGGALRAQGLRGGRALGHRQLRPVGRRARQDAGQTGAAGAAGRSDGPARPVDHGADPAAETVKPSTFRGRPRKIGHGKHRKADAVFYARAFPWLSVFAVVQRTSVRDEGIGRAMAINQHNLAHWNEVTAHHVASPFYRTEDFRNGEIVLDPVVRGAVGDVAGKRLLHLQCHFGLDTLSLARMGATVTGLDFSPVAIEQARALAAEAGIDATFVCADVLAPPPGLGGFDIVFASWGAIYWIADLHAWMRVAAGALRPGGRLSLTEGHPALTMLDERAEPGAPLTVKRPWDSPEPIVDVGDLDYTGAKVAANRTEGYA